MILGAQTYRVTREAEPGSYDTNGRYVPGATTELEVVGAVQPLTPRQVEALPEKARTSAKALFLCDAHQPELKVTDLDQPGRGDRVEVDGREYVLMALEDRTAFHLPYRSYVLLEASHG